MPQTHPESNHSTNSLCSTLFHHDPSLTFAQVDISKVAEALKYKNPASVANRIRVLKKQFGLDITCSNGTANGTTSGSPRKGAKTAQSRGPVKATGDGNDVPTTPAKKRGRKPKAEKEAADEEKNAIKKESGVKVEDGDRSDDEKTVKNENDEA